MVKQISVKHIACLSLLSTSMAHAAERPNIIYIFTDQHTANAMSCAGNPDLHTPNLDRLAAAGIMFQNAYCTAPLSGPSRGAMFTGCYPGTTGLLVNGAPLQESLQTRTLGTLVKNAGYECAYGGKWHVPELDIPDKVRGFDQIYKHSDDGLAEACVELFDEKAEFTVTPAGMTLHYGDAVLNEQLVEKDGDCIYVYGNLTIPDNANLRALSDSITKLTVKGNVTLKKNQAEDFKKLNVEYSELTFKWEGRLIENKISVKIDKTLLESSPDKVLVRSTAAAKIAPDITPELILDRLVIENCAKVYCSEEQESAVAAVSQNIAAIVKESSKELSEMSGGFDDLLSTKVINADSYIM